MNNTPVGIWTYFNSNSGPYPICKMSVDLFTGYSSTKSVDLDYRWLASSIGDRWNENPNPDYSKVAYFIYTTTASGRGSLINIQNASYELNPMNVQSTYYFSDTIPFTRPLGPDSEGNVSFSGAQYFEITNIAILGVGDGLSSYPLYNTRTSIENITIFGDEQGVHVSEPFYINMGNASSVEYVCFYPTSATKINIEY